ncbi:Aste57867_1393 [Aphanomyces stellatus]|uniref:Aste57867_1393 protein n=1 Tax=Aphanomyces stellatus TaxID=120398 RepID=A0A485K569_9STRA|nr:hypothetical protein As57867_001392 [Aphanomyces stellatus]VFT78610.1 Aste57867_1393 [Aphanomyces stellatus]
MSKELSQPPKKPGIYLVDDDFEDTMSISMTNVMKEDDYVVLEEGALVPGGAISLMSMEAMSLFAQYAAVGVVYGTLPGLQYPIFKIFFKMEGYQVAAYSVLVNIAWSFKIFMGGVSDCVTIYGYRRKPWMVIGWAICLVALLFMAFTPTGAPQCVTNVQDTAACSLTSRDEAYRFTLGAMLATFGYVLSACASDALVVQYAQRESLASRGRIQTAIYTVRSVGQLLSCVLVGLLLNGKDYGGQFDFSVTVNVIYGILCVPCVLAMVSATWWLREEKTESVPFGKWIDQFWMLTQKQAMWQILAFRFISNVFQNFDSTANKPMAQYWAHVQPFTDAFTHALGWFIFSAILTIVGRYGLNWNWRWTIGVATVALIAIDATVYFLTIWNVVRNPWFYTGVTLTDQIPTGVRFIVSVFVATELADLGNEGAVYGLVTTINNLATPTATVLYKSLDSYFNYDDSKFRAEVNATTPESDRDEIRWNVSYSYLLAYAMKLGSLVWLFMLPPQKAHVQRLKRYGIVSPLAARITWVLFFIFLAFSIFVNLASMFQSTSWWRIAGGSGVRPK